MGIFLVSAMGISMISALSKNVTDRVTDALGRLRSTTTRSVLAQGIDWVLRFQVAVADKGCQEDEEELAATGANHREGSQFQVAVADKGCQEHEEELAATETRTVQAAAELTSDHEVSPHADVPT